MIALKYQILLLFGTFFLFFLPSACGQATSNNSIQISTLSVSFANNFAPTYQITLNTNEKFILSQSYSWIRDQNSRYNLVSYSLDEEDLIPISRVPRGNFTIDIPTDSSHSIVFYAVPQYPISVNGAEEFSFSPESPTNDNWFDAESEVSIIVNSKTSGLVTYEVAAWEGPILRSDVNSALVRVDSPILVEVKWKENYLPLLVSILIPIISISAFFLLRRRAPKVVQKQIRSDKDLTIEQTSKKFHSDFEHYAKLKALEKLDLLLNSKVITEDKHSRIKQKLE